MRPREQSKQLSAAQRLGRVARERAEREARHIPWQRLLAARTQYVDWQEFYFWVRSVLEVEKSAPDWLIEILRDRCPGLLDTDQGVAAEGKPLGLALEEWIENHIFAQPKDQGWFNAIMFYAVRDPRYQRAEVCWSESVARWKKARPTRYPTFEEWKLRAEACDDAAHLSAEIRRIREKAKTVSRERLAAAVAAYMDWEAFAYWARPALESGADLPEVVVRELDARCAGYIAVRSVQKSEARDREWNKLMGWIVEHCFSDANAEGWFDVVLLEAQNHPRTIRSREYADHWEESYGSKPPGDYPTFEDWRKAADRYVEEPSL